MKILSMTATFGKLERQTLSLQPGLNVIHAPNEWGKSTWCAFIVAMLYGVDTRERTTLTGIAVKERYNPWSGSAMSGRMDILWQGRAITLERSTKGRTPMGVFRAYETDTGLDVPELTGDNCGQQLLGVEKSVFLRSAFLRGSDMPVTQDEALRKRLNALVTTADESGTAEALEQDLKELRNKIRANRANGLLPAAQGQREEIQEKLRELEQLQTQSADIKQQLADLEERQKNLQNHKAALRHQAQQAQAEKLQDARAALLAAQLKTRELEEVCKDLPDGQTIRENRQQLQQLRDGRDDLMAQLQLMPPEPQPPEVPEVFRGISPQQALQQARADYQTYTADSRNKPYALVGLGMAILGIAGIMIPNPVVTYVGVALTIIGLVLCFILYVQRAGENRARLALHQKYGMLAPENWEQAALDYGKNKEEYENKLSAHRQKRTALEKKLEALNDQLEALTGGETLAQCERRWEEICGQWQKAEDARKEQRRLEELVQALQPTGRLEEAPAQPDSLTLTLPETESAMADCAYRQRRLIEQLGNCQGRMEALGQEQILQRMLQTVDTRIEKLEETYAALTLALETLAQAQQELQRRFAPRISQRAQTLLNRLTGGRYERLHLDSDLAVHTATTEETTTHVALQRSEGTVDQLYFALRLAVSEELTPEAPLVLDDALVRFDDTRAAAALQILQEAAENKQVILFTCQSRETQIYV